VVAQDCRPPPVRCGVETGELDLPGNAQAVAGHRHRHLAVAGHYRMARAGAGFGDDGVIAALGLERDAVAGCKGQRAGACAGGDHCDVTRNLARCHRHRREDVRLDTEPAGARPDPLRAKCHGVLDQRGNVGAGIGAVAAGLDQHAESIAPVEFGLLLAQLVRIEFQPLHPVVPAQPPRQRFVLEIDASREDVEQAAPLDQVSNPGLRGQTLMPPWRVGHQRTQRAGNCFYPRHRRSGPQKAREPGG